MGKSSVGRSNKGVGACKGFKNQPIPGKELYYFCFVILTITATP